MLSNYVLIVGDVNECKLNNGGCSSNAICINTDGSYYCECKSGYIGDGFTCFEAANQGPSMVILLLFIIAQKVKVAWHLVTDKVIAVMKRVSFFQSQCTHRKIDERFDCLTNSSKYM